MEEKRLERAEGGQSILVVGGGWRWLEWKTRE